MMRPQFVHWRDYLLTLRVFDQIEKYDLIYEELYINSGIQVLLEFIIYKFF